MRTELFKAIASEQKIDLNAWYYDKQRPQMDLVEKVTVHHPCLETLAISVSFQCAISGLNRTHIFLKKMRIARRRSIEHDFS